MVWWSRHVLVKYGTVTQCPCGGPKKSRNCSPMTVYDILRISSVPVHNHRIPSWTNPCKTSGLGCRSTTSLDISRGQENSANEIRRRFPSLAFNGDTCQGMVPGHLYYHTLATSRLQDHSKKSTSSDSATRSLAVWLSCLPSITCEMFMHTSFS